MKQGKMYASKKYPSPPQGGLSEIPRRRGGGLKSKNIDGKYELTLEFAEGLEEGGCQTKNNLWEG